MPAFKTADVIKLPIAETSEKRMILFEVCAYDPTDAEIEQMVNELWQAI